MTSAGKPGKLVWALMMYLPLLVILMPRFINKGTWNFAIMTPQEGLGSWKNMSYNNSGSEGIHDMLIVGMEKKPIVNMAWIS